jgi:hypothetical protein
MASIGSTSILRRGKAAFAAAVVVAGLAVGGSAPALAAAPMTTSTARACVPGKILDFCRAVPPGHGFRLANGVYETIDVPGASLTVPYRSNNRGQVVGGYLDAGGKVRGLLGDTKGTFTTFDDPDATSQTGALDINDRRQIVGVFR